MRGCGFPYRRRLAHEARHPSLDEIHAAHVEAHLLLLDGPRRPSRIRLARPAQIEMNPSPADIPVSDQGRLATLWTKVVTAALAVADADPAKVESAARQFGASRRYLAPVAWVAGAIVLLVRGVKLLLLNWRLTLIQLVPAVWLWLLMWDLKQHALRHVAFRHITVGGMIVLVVLAVAASIASFWCNTVFAFAITDRRPRIRPAARRAQPYLGRIAVAGAALGLLVAGAAIVIPRIGPTWLYVIVLGGLYSVMLVSFVVVPARIIGVKKQKLPPKQALGRLTVGSALSAVAMTPGFVLDRLGLVLLGVPGFHVVGFILLSVGTALYAAGMSSVRVVKLSMKLETPE